MERDLKVPIGVIFYLMMLNLLGFSIFSTLFITYIVKCY